MKGNYELLGKKVDAILINNDNTALAALPIIGNKAKKNSIDVISSDIDTINNGATIAIGPDQYKLGQEVGAIAMRVLAEEDIKKIPIGFPKSEGLIKLDNRNKMN